jgi:hypothetical protein
MSIGQVIGTPINVNRVGDFDLTTINLESDYKSEAEKE